MNRSKLATLLAVLVIAVAAYVLGQRSVEGEFAPLDSSDSAAVQQGEQAAELREQVERNTRFREGICRDLRDNQEDLPRDIRELVRALEAHCE